MRGRPPITQAMRAGVAERFGCGPGRSVWITCNYCDDPILIDRTEANRTRFLDSEHRSLPELDHVEPLFLGGPHTVSNLVPACLRCNRAKGARRLVTE